MDIKQYIESGILESYVLGSASPQEVKEVECISSIYPEIKTELNSLQSNLEKYIESIAVQPPAFVKEKIMKAIKSQRKANKVESKLEKEGKVISLGNSNFYKFGMAASVALLMGFFLYKNITTSKLEDRLAQSERELEENSNKNLASNKRYQDSINRFAEREQLLTDANTKLIALSGTPVSPDSKVKVFWNKTSSKILIVQDDLPKPSEELQYQLWGLVDGAPVSLGMLAKSETISDVREIGMDKVDAFAITLEKNGGSPTPNLEQLFVIGNT